MTLILASVGIAAYFICVARMRARRVSARINKPQRRQR
jgi:hypothetical protein